MKKLLLLLALLPTALMAQSQEAEVVVTFDRGTAAFDAHRLVNAIVDHPQFPTFGDEFSPLYLSAQLDTPPPSQTLSALFESGAVSVEVVRTAAQIAAWAGTDVEEIETFTKGAPPGYLVRVGYASVTPTDQAAATFASILGVEPTTVKKDANEMRLRVPESTALSVAERLQSSAGVVAVRVE
jgi:hypothetical protein